MNAILEDGKLKVEFDIDNIDKNILSYLSLIETASKSQATEEEIWELSEEIKSNWWKENKEKLLNEKDRN